MMLFGGMSALVLTCRRADRQMSRHVGCVSAKGAKCHDMSQTFRQPDLRQMSQRMSRHLCSGQSPPTPRTQPSHWLVPRIMASMSSCSGAPPNPLPARSPLASSPEPRSSPIPPRVPLQLALIPFPTCFHSDRIKNSIHSNQRRDEPLGVGQKRAPALLAHLDHPQQARDERPPNHTHTTTKLLGLV